MGLLHYFGHEVYVLSPSEISRDEHQQGADVWHALASAHDRSIFIAYSLGVVVGVVVLLYLKRQRLFKRIGKLIDKGTVFAPDFIRVVFGLSLIFAARHQAVFGPELPIDSFSFHILIAPFLYIVGVLTVLGIATRWLGIAASLFWLFTFIDRGWYMLTYANYLGEALALVFLPRQNFSLDKLLTKPSAKLMKYEQWSMPVARILFGFSLFYTALNVKFAASALPLDVVHRYDLQRYFHYDPMLIVLGAALVEILIAALYMLGFLQRVNSLIFIAFITLSISFFKEEVWPHYLLLALAVGIFIHAPDLLSLDSRISARTDKRTAKKRRLRPRFI